jgi:hypothetical protein
VSDGNTLNIVSFFPQPMNAVVTGDNFNCCDSPKPGANIGLIPPGGQVSMFYVRTDGHGCNSRQGQFTLSLNSQFSIVMNFDSNGAMAPIAPSGGFGAWLAQNNDNTFTLIVGPTPQS